jgi:hypothetical protein
MKYNLEKYTITLWDHHLEQVMKFNHIAGNTKKDKNFLRGIYRDLCVEEANETVCAFNGTDVDGNELTERESLRELVDGCCDIFYVAGFYQHFLEGLHLGSTQLGYTLELNINQIHMYSGGFNGRIDPIYLLCSARNILIDLNIDHNAALEEVHKSNLSKFIDVTGIPKDDILEIALLESADIKNIYKEKGNELLCVVYETVNYEDETYLVFRNENGKVLKPSSFVEPNLDKVIDHLFN